MEKLIELLNEYEPYIATDGWRDNLWGYVYQGYSAVFPKEIGMLKIISKEYGFIEWLVENDKIDTNNLSLKAFKNIFSGGGFVEVSDLEVLLMLLSISDRPIEDLISYLK